MIKSQKSLRMAACTVRWLCDRPPPLARSAPPPGAMRSFGRDRADDVFSASEHGGGPSGWAGPLLLSRLGYNVIPKTTEEVCRPRRPPAPRWALPRGTYHPHREWACRDVLGGQVARLRACIATHRSFMRLPEALLQVARRQLAARLLLSTAPRRATQAVIGVAEPAEFQKGACICEIGLGPLLGDKIFFLERVQRRLPRRARMRSHRTTPTQGECLCLCSSEGGEKVLSFPAIFGELSLLFNAPRSTTIIVRAAALRTRSLARSLARPPAHPARALTLLCAERCVLHTQALTDVKAWSLSRAQFVHLMQRPRSSKRSSTPRLLRTGPCMS
jgi:hypothetical protein